VVERLTKKRILAGVPASRLYPRDRALADLLIVTATETTADADIEAFAQGLEEAVR
jgi:glycine dehydrogenase subunit 1